MFSHNTYTMVGWQISGIQINYSETFYANPPTNTIYLCKHDIAYKVTSGTIFNSTFTGSHLQINHYQIPVKVAKYNMDFREMDQSHHDVLLHDTLFDLEEFPVPVKLCRPFT